MLKLKYNSLWIYEVLHLREQPQLLEVNPKYTIYKLDYKDIHHSLFFFISENKESTKMFHNRRLAWGFPGKNTGLSYHSFLQKIFLTQGSKLWLLYLLCLLHWQADYLILRHPGRCYQTPIHCNTIVIKNIAN